MKCRAPSGKPCACTVCALKDFGDALAWATYPGLVSFSNPGPVETFRPEDEYPAWFIAWDDGQRH